MNGMFKLDELPGSLWDYLALVFIVKKICVSLVNYAFQTRFAL